MAVTYVETQLLRLALALASHNAHRNSMSRMGGIHSCARLFCPNSHGPLCTHAAFLDPLFDTLLDPPSGM
jgi:hypothetical protein